MKTWRRITVLLTVCLVGGLSAATPSVNSPVYAFRGIDVSAHTKWGIFPVVSAGRWGLQVDTPKGQKRVGYGANFRLKPKHGLASTIVEVVTFEVSLSYQRRYERESEAITELQLYETATESVISDLRYGERSIAGDTNLQIEALRDEYQDLEENLRLSLEDEDFDSDDLNDSIVIELEMRSPRDVEGAFGVVVVYYNIPDASAPERRRFTTTGRLNRIGDIKANVLKKVKLRMRVPEGYLDEARYAFYLLTGQSENIATSKSIDLRRLTPSQLKELDR